MYNWGKLRSQKDTKEAYRFPKKKCNYLLHVYHYRGDRFGDDIKKMSLIIDIFRNEVNYTNA